MPSRTLLAPGRCSRSPTEPEAAPGREAAAFASISTTVGGSVNFHRRTHPEVSSNLNHGQDTRANRTRHTTSSSTQSHAKRPLTSRRTGKAPVRAASPIPHRPQCTGKPLEAHTRHTGRDITGTHQCCNTRFIGCARRPWLAVLVGRTVEPIEHRAQLGDVRVANSAAGRREPSWDRASSAAGSSPRRPGVEPGHAWIEDAVPDTALARTDRMITALNSAALVRSDHHSDTLHGSWL